MTVTENILSRDLPPLLGGTDWEKRREEIFDILQKEEYGYFPEPPVNFSVEDTGKVKTTPGTAVHTEHIMHLSLANGESFSFPFTSVIPKVDKPCPAFVFLNFRPYVPDKYLPTEELVDYGFAVFSFCYENITSDDGDFTNGLAGAIFKCEPRKPDSAGKITLWSWAASRICDYVMTLPSIDKTKLAVAGHSRLGKTALLTGAHDTRFSFVASNCAGCSGDALMRGKVEKSETVKAIYDRFPFWFCENYGKYTEKPEIAQFDQHFLLSLTAPRHIMICCAEQDVWADPAGEYASAVAAGEVWQKIYGIDPGLPTDVFPLPLSAFDSGAIGFRYRHGTHFFSRSDWKFYVDFINKH